MGVRKKALIALCMVVTFAILAACGSNNADNGPSGSPATGSPAGTAAAPDLSGKLVIYTGSGTEITDPLLAGFKKQYPDVKIEIVKAGSGELLARIAAEQSNPGGDVLLGGQPYSFESNKDRFEPYESPNDKEMIREDSNHIWHVWSFMPQAIMVNTKLLKDESAWPKSIKDLADPKWQGGKIALADPGKSGTGAAIVNGIVTLYDWDFMTQLLKNVEVLSGSDAMFAAVKDGSVPVGFINEDLGAKWEQTGLPVKMIYPSDGVTNVMDSLAIIKGAKNMDNAKAFVDYMGSKEAQEILRDDVLRRSTRKDVTPPEGLSDLSQFNMVDAKMMSSDEIGNNFNERLEQARR